MEFEGRIDKHYQQGSNPQRHAERTGILYLFGFQRVTGNGNS
jgi:hypothetical protein